METEPRPDLTWAVVYDDGSVLREYEADGTFHYVHEIDRSKVDMFKAVNNDGSFEFCLNLKTGEFTVDGKRAGLVPAEMPVPTDGRYDFIWFKRVRTDFDMSGPHTTVRYAVGARTTKAGQSYQWIAWLQEGMPVEFTNEK